MTEMDGYSQRRLKALKFGPSLKAVRADHSMSLKQSDIKLHS